MSEGGCDYRYPGNHKRCGRPKELHERFLRPWQEPGGTPFNYTADNHDFVCPPWPSDEEFLRRHPEFDQGVAPEHL